MKKLSDYKGEEALDLWIDIIEPLTSILSDKALKELSSNNMSVLSLASEILKRHKKEAVEILTTIDDTPIDGANIITRVIGFVEEFVKDKDMQAFFSSQEQTEGKTVCSCSMESIKETEKI